jgi:hypothetical protein
MIDYPLPINFSNYELILMRLFFAYIIIKSFLPKSVKFKSQPNPTGIARYIDLTFLSNPQLFKKLRIVIFALLAVYVSGFGLYICTLLLFIYTLLIGTLNNSQGSISHNNQIVSLILLVQSIVYLVGVFNYQEIINFTFFDTYNDNQIAIFFSQQAIVAVYFTSVVTKLVNSKLRWLRQVKNISIQLEKNAMQYYYNHLDFSPVDRMRNISSFLINNPNLTMFVFGSGLFLEILSPLSLFRMLFLVY